MNLLHAQLLAGAEVRKTARNATEIETLADVGWLRLTSLAGIYQLRESHRADLEARQAAVAKRDSR